MSYLDDSLLCNIIHAHTIILFISFASKLLLFFFYSLPGRCCCCCGVPPAKVAICSSCCCGCLAIAAAELFSSAVRGCGEGVVSCSLALESLLESLPLPPLLLLYICCTWWRWWWWVICGAAALIPRMSSMEWLPEGDLLLSLSLMVITAHCSLMLQLPSTTEVC